MKPTKSIPTLISLLWTGVLLFAISGCATQDTVRRGREFLPGGAAFYSFGISQSKANLENIEVAQSAYGLHARQRTWNRINAGRAPGMLNILQSYYPLSVRWQLKNGQQYMLENIDVRSIMQQYFQTNTIDLPWNKEGRPRAKSGDFDPALVHEVKDDTLLIKWLIITNTTPVSERFTTQGAATRWVFVYEELLVATIKGTPTQRIDFKKVWEFNCPGPECIKE